MEVFKSKKKKNLIINIICLAVLCAVAVSMLFPLLYMLSMSIRPKGSFMEFPPKLIPRAVSFRAYVDIWTEINIFSGIKNTLIIILIVLPCQLFTSSLSAFAFAKINFVFKNKLFMILLMTIMIPFPVTMIPLFKIFDSFNMIDTLFPLILPGTLGSVGVMFFLIQYLKTIPNALIESAKIDGSGYLGIFIKIIVPLIKAALAAQAIFIFMGIWNDLLGPVIYLSTSEKLTLQYQLATLESFYSTGNDYPMIMAGGMISVLPLIVVFLAFQRQIIESLALSGIKG